MRDKDVKNSQEFQEKLTGKAKFETVILSSSKNKKIKNTPKENESIYYQLFKHNINAVLLTSPDGGILAANPVACKLFGRTEDEIKQIGRNGVVDLTDPRLIDTLDEREHTGEFQGELSFIRKDGTKFPGELTSLVFNDKDGKVRTCMTIQDITECKKAEQEHLANLHFFESMDRINRAIQRTNDLEQMMSDVLDEVLSIFDCDRAWLVYPCDPEATSWCAPMERAKPKYPGANALGLEVPIDSDVIRVYRTVLASDGPVQFHSQSEHALPTAVAEQFNEQSQIAMAIYPKGDKPYMFGLHQCSYPRIWTRQEETLLKEIGRRLADGLTSLLMYRNLKARETKYRELADSITDIFFAMDQDLRYTYWNKASENLTGIQAENALGKSILEVFPDTPWVRRAEKVYRDVLRMQQPRTFVNEVDYKDKSYVLEISAYPSMSGLSVFVKDITDRIRAQEAFQTSQVQLSNAAKIAQIGYWEYDVADRLFTFNDQFYSIFQTTVEQVGSYTMTPESYIEMFLHPDDRPIVTNEMKKVIETPGTNFNRQLEHRILYSDGEIGTISVRYFVIKNDQGRTLKVYGAIQDITERKKEQDALNKSQVQLSQTLKMSKIGYWEYDMIEKMFTFNDQFYSVYRTSAKKVGGYKMSLEHYAQVFLYPEKAHELYNNMQKLSDGIDVPENISREHEVRFGDGKTGYVSVSFFFIRDDKGNVVKIYGANQDVTERKQAEQELEKEHNLLRLLIDNIPDRIFLKDKERRFILGNNAMFRHKGFESEDELIGKTDFDLYPEKDAKAFCSQEKEIIKKGKSIINERCFYKDKNGNEEWSMLTKVPLRDLNGDIIGLAGIKRNVTEQKKAEDALRESEEKLRLILDTVPAMIWLKDVNGKYVWTNKYHADSIGVQKEKATGQSDFNIFSKELAEKFQKDDKEVLKTLKPKLGIVEQYNKSDGTIGWVRTNKIPFFNNNELVGTIGFAADITEQKLAQDALQENESLLNEVGRFAKIGGWERDLITKKGKWTKAKYDIYEIDYNEPIPSREEYINFFLPEYRPIVVQAIKKLIEDDIPMDVEARLKTAKGNIIWCRSVGRSIRKDGVCIKVFGTFQDITDNKRAEEALNNHRRLLEKQMYLSKTLLDAIPCIAMLIKPKTREIVASNKAAIKVGAIPGKTCYETWAQRTETCPWCMATKLWKTGKKQHIEVEHMGTVWDVYWVPVSDDLYMHFAFDITERKKIEASILKYQKQLKSLASQLTLTEEKERYRIATHLHDQIGQYLAVSRIKLVELLNSDISEGTYNTLQLIDEWLYHAIRETRSLTYDLSSPILHELGLEKAIKAWLDDEIRKKYQVKTEFYSDKLSRSLDDDIQTLLFRDVRELLFNVVKHAHAKKVKVSIKTKDNNILITIEDDGVGFNPAEIVDVVPDKEKFGLFSIRERLEHFGGNIEIDSAPNKGCKITLIAPLKKD